MYVSDTFNGENVIECHRWKPVFGHIKTRNDGLNWIKILCWQEFIEIHWISKISLIWNLLQSINIQFSGLILNELQKQTAQIKYYNVHSLKKILASLEKMVKYIIPTHFTF